MAKKISQLTQATEVKSDDVTVIVQDGETKKLPLNMMVTKQDIENKKIAGLAKLDEIEATYENDTYTPTITVKNKSSVKTGEGDEVDYSANVMDGHVKSAILSGNTLVNLASEKTKTGANNLNIMVDYLKPNTQYTVIFNYISDNPINGRCSLGNTMGVNNMSFVGENGLKKVLLATPELTSSNYRLFIYTNNNATYTVDEVMVIEGNHTNVDIPYFTGMQSVKLPVLMTTGKNLFNYNTTKYTATGCEWYGIKLNGYIGDVTISFPETISYFELYTSTEANVGLLYKWDNGKAFIEQGAVNNYNVPSTYDYLILRFENNMYAPTQSFLEAVQIEKGSTATSYEPYKSNILTVNEEVTLRGIGNVKDTLDCLTGEVTERIGEIVLDGSEGWSYNTNNFTAISKSQIVKIDNTVDDMKTDVICDKLPSTKTGDGIRYYSKSGMIYITKQFSNSQEFLEWLSIEKPVIQYQLPEKSIKTVDLMPSGTHPSTTPYCWKNGHIQLSSSGLLPNLEYSVVTSRAGQINQNATMVVKNDKRIFDLEILLAGGLVNTTYQALTLQNQVETGLSKVSLNSETEPDYLLYHMIMKLIEEKAYKLDDLTEKVSVFYLYEKLSDEQFETIYSALYPFAEDEIIEEPVVEELPEVVEDEVIM